MSAPTPSKNPAFKPVRLQHVMREVRRPVFVKPETRYTEIGVRSHGRGVFHKEPITGEDLGNKRVFWLKPGTLVFNIVFAWERSVAVLSEDEAGLIASHRFPMYEMLPGRAHAGFMKHYFTTGYGHYLLRLNSPGAAGRNKTLNQSALMKEEVWLPPAETQRAIADFLDRKTAAIDALIGKKERLLALLAEQRAALIHRAVTRGLDPDVEMKDSGVEWIGEVPAHWQVLRTRFLCDMTTGGRDTQDATDDGAYPFFVRSQTVQRIDSWSFEGEAVLTSGDGAGVGKIFHHHIGKLEYHQRVYLFHRFRRVLGRFFYYFLREHLLGVVLGGTAKSTVDSLRAPMLLDFPIAVGPIDEQRDIIEFCDDVEGRYERLTTSLNTQLDRLREYRQALITAAVTGQLDLSSEAAA